MATIKQKSNGFASYLGWFGTCDGPSCDIKFDLATDPRIHMVIKSDSGHPITYVNGNPWSLQAIKSLQCGNIYWITLSPGESELTIDGFVLSSEYEASNVSELPMLSSCDAGVPGPNTTLTPADQYVSYLGWYGMCDNKNSNVKLTLSDIPSVHSVFQTTPNGGVISYIKGHPEFLQTLKTLSPGNAYWITLEPGYGELEIDGFSASSSVDVSGIKKPVLIDLHCNPEQSVGDATPTPLVSVTPTPQPKKKIKLPVMLLAWEWSGSWREPGDSLKFDTDMYLFDDYDYRKLLKSDILDMLNSENYKHPTIETGGLPTGSVADYFRSISFGQWDVEFEIIPAGLNAAPESDTPDDFAYLRPRHYRESGYNTLRKHTLSNSEKMKIQWDYDLRNAINKGFENMRTNLDTQGRSYVHEFGDMPLTIIHSGFSSAGGYGGDYIRSHKSSVNVGLSENIIYSVSNIKTKVNIKTGARITSLEPIGVHVHESIHTYHVMDLYDKTGVGTGLNKLAVMSYGNWGSGPSLTKYLPTFALGWTRYELSKRGLFDVTIVDITKTTLDIEISPSCEQNILYRIHHPTEDDVWWVDYRTPNATSSSGVNFDRFLQESGLCIVHQGDTRGPRTNTKRSPNNRRGESGYYISLEQSDGTFALQHGDMSVSNDLYKPGEEFSPYSIPSSVSRTGTPSGIKVDNIRETNHGTVMFDVTYTTEPEHKITSVDYNFADTSHDINSVPRSTWDKRQFRDDIVVSVTTENIPSGTRINLKFNPTIATGITGAHGVVENNMCTMNIKNAYMTNMTRDKNVNYIYYEIDEKHKQYSNTFPWIDYIIVKQ